MNLVFASGFLLPQQLGPLDYFNGMKAFVESKGHRPLFHVVRPLGKSEARSDSLAGAIRAAFPTGPLHIIGHSMGGLDSRHLIARNADLASRIVSLTTLSTPYRGSPLADLLVGGRPGFLSFVRRGAYDAISAAIGGLIDIGALGDLTAAGASRGPDVATTHPHIRYRSYAASGRADARKTSFLLLPGHIFIVGRPEGGPNDGAVTVESAKYGEFQDTWPCDHLDMVGHDLDKPGFAQGEFNHLVEFDKIITKLQAEHPGT
jgi:triacylglycerol lipase